VEALVAPNGHRKKAMFSSVTLNAQFSATTALPYYSFVQHQERHEDLGIADTKLMSFISQPIFLYS
jgi:hypothetical protein